LFIGGGGGWKKRELWEGIRIRGIKRIELKGKKMDCGEGGNLRLKV
jgi:hypothetical protein